MLPSGTSLWARHNQVEPAGLVTCLTAGRSPASTDEEVRWALLADPHISADPATVHTSSRPAEHAQRAVEEILASGSQAAWINGDLAWDEGLPGDYAHLRSILEPLAAQIPVCLTLGNHDSRSGFLTEFAPALAETAVEKALAVIEHGPIRWILLDSLFRTDVVAGLLGQAQRQWLQRLLETSDLRPTLIAVHHPLDEDDDSLLDGDRLFGLVEPFPQVKAIFTAHDHAYRAECRGGIHIVSLPALGMPFEAREPVGWIEASLTAGEGVFVFHAVGKNCLRDGSAMTLAWR